MPIFDHAFEDDDNDELAREIESAWAALLGWTAPKPEVPVDSMHAECAYRDAIGKTTEDLKQWEEEQNAWREDGEQVFDVTQEKLKGGENLV